MSITGMRVSYTHKIKIIYMKSLFLFIITLLLFSCNNRDLSRLDSLTRIDNTEQNVMVISTAIENSLFIPLKTNQQTFIGSYIGKIRNVSGYYYISCDHKRILKFGPDGEYLMEVNNIGAGPREYTFLADYDVTPSFIAILDVNKILLYSSETGEYSNTIKLDCIGSAIKILTDDLFAIYTSGGNTSVKIINSNGKEINNSGGRTSLSRLSRRCPFISLHTNSFIIQQGYSNNLIAYDFQKDEFKNIKLIDTKEYISQEQENDLIRKYGNRYYNDSDNNLISDISSSGEDMMFIAKDKGNYTCYVANKASGKIKYSFNDKVINDLTFTNPNIWGYTSSCFSDDAFLSYLNMEELKEGLENYTGKKNTENYRILEKLLLSSGDNIDLILVKFKFKP